MPRGKAAKSLQLIEASAAILEEIQPATVRAVCYPLFNVYRLIPDMSKNSTNKVSTQLLWAREEGRIPWEWIVDETRAPEGNPGWDEPEAFTDYALAVHGCNPWADQRRLVMVVSEKGTVRGTIRPVTDKYHVQFYPLHGYGSGTALHGLAELSRDLPDHRQFTILYVGDYDPSGMQMSEVDLPGRLNERYGGRADIYRIALTTGDIQGGRLPSFPVEGKSHDPRFKWWHEQGYGVECWELDAMSPTVLRERVEQTICDLIDDVPAWNRAMQAEKVERESLTGFLHAWANTLKRAS